MEALASLGIDWKLLLSQVVNFLILLFVLKRYLYGPVVKMLSDRREKVTKSMEDVKAAEEKLATAQMESKKILDKAVNEADSIAKAAKKSAQDEASKILADASEKAQKVSQNAKISAEREKDQIVEKAKKNLAELVTIATEKIIEIKPAPDDVAKAISEIR